MIPKLDDYEEIVGDKLISLIREKASLLSEKHVEHINSTFIGGGVAEILNSLVLLMNDVGIATGWRILKGHPDFFNITKSFHNALQGNKNFTLTGDIKKKYEECSEVNSKIMHIQECDFIVVHDPQPLPLIKFYEKNQPWVWRLHIDLTDPHGGLWEYLKTFILEYNLMIVSMDAYKKELPLPQRIIHPSIDPLTDKNKDISEEEAFKHLRKYGIENDKPIISQVSRFDPWKDPLGVIDAYKLIKKKHDCQLVLMANMASDDPEGPKIYEQVVEKAKEAEDIHFIVNAEDNDIVVNSLQRVSHVVIQKSTREGFGLTVTEALWKGTPVVGGNVGGIPLQVIDKKTGFLVNNVQECADRVLRLLKDDKLRETLGKNAKEHVKNNFLITRHLMDYIELINNLS
jgi:trehalose synthase